MIVCSCNLIRAADIRAAVNRGARDAESAYRAVGCEFECGGCRDLAEEIVEEALSEPAEESSQAA
jgi:bacterioferritin-associated ferredoxin